MKYMYGYIVLLFSTIAVSEQCLDPSTISQTHVYLSNDPGIEKILKDIGRPHVSSNVSIYTLNESPLVQYALVEENGTALAIQLNEPFEATVGLVTTHYESILSKFLNKSKEQVFSEMKEQCTLFVLQKNMEKTMCYLLIIGGVILVYVLYTVFNFVVNFRSIRKLYRESSAIDSVFSSLSQALTSRRISKYHQIATEKLHVDVHRRMNALENKIKAMEESARLNNMLSKDKTTVEYDYVTCEDKNRLNDWNDIKNNTISGYLTPINTYATEEKV